jgi:hypothetical protein
MDSIFKHQIKLAINRLKENNFQEFVNALYIKKYGTDFTPIKQKKDKGCDGILKNGKIIAAYAPENYRLNKFKSKTKEDYDKYVQNWRDRHPKWCLVYNGPFTAEMVGFIDSLDHGVEKVDINQIIKLIESLNWSDIRDIADYLGIDGQYFINDILQNVVDDLLKNSSKASLPSQKHKPPYIEHKIEANFDFS